MNESDILVIETRDLSKTYQQVNRRSGWLWQWDNLSRRLCRSWRTRLGWYCSPVSPSGVSNMKNSRRKSSAVSPVRLNAGLSGLASALLVQLVRVPREEQMMIEHFGDEYRAYMQRTGGIIPRLWRNPPETSNYPKGVQK